MRYQPFQAARGLPRAVWILAAAAFVNRAGTMVVPFLTLYLTRRLGFAPGVAGVMFLVYGASAIVGNALAGRLCDRVGARRVLVGCLALSGAALFAFPCAATPVGVACAVCAFALTSEGVRPSTLTLVGAMVEPSRRKDAFVVNRLAVNLGMSIGPGIGGVLVDSHPHALFYVDGATSIAAASLVVALGRYLARSAPGVAPPQESAGPAKAARGALGDPRFLRFLAGVVCVGFVFFQLDGALPLYLVGAHGMSPKVYGLLFIINTAMILAFEVPLNSATSRWPHARALAVGAGLVAVGFGGFALGTTFWSAGACIVVITCGEMILFPAMSAFVADAAPEGRGGAYMGAFSTAFAIAYAVAPAAGIAVLGRFGGAALWCALLVTGALTAALFVVVGRDKTPDSEAAADT